GSTSATTESGSPSLDTYRLRLIPAAPTASPWQADTLWGHLCWMLVRRRGEPALLEFLDAYTQGDPPLVLSDGFPADLLPRLLLPLTTPASGTKQEGIEAARRSK